MRLAELVMATGWTWDEARKLPYHAYLLLQRYWQEVAPPLCVTMASFAGFKPKAPQDRPDRPATTEEIFVAFGLNPSAPAREVKRETKVFKF
jgi:hypothetical protein